MRPTKPGGPTEELGSRLRRLRIARRLGVKEMAALLEVPIGTYRDWENGRAIQGEPYSRIAEVLQVGLVELLEGRCPEVSKCFELMSRIETSVLELKKELQSLF